MVTEDLCKNEKRKTRKLKIMKTLLCICLLTFLGTSLADDEHILKKRGGPVFPFLRTLMSEARRSQDGAEIPINLPIFHSLGFPKPVVEIDSGGIRVKAEESDRDERNANDDEGRITTGAPRCTTPSGGQGRCMDIQNCPLLIADLDKLRKSICFKSLFSPGVCCPDGGVTLVNFENDNSVSSSLPPTEVTTLPSLSDFPSTTQEPPPPFINELLNTVPGTNQECGISKVPQSRIVGGNVTFEGENPWMVALFLHGKQREEFWCGGALVSDRHVVTAAHCTKDAKKRPFRPSQFTAKIGEWDLKDSDGYTREIRIAEITAHPDFKPNGFYNDVAIFKLEQPVTFNQHIQPICLPTGPLRFRNFVGTQPMALGWGTTYYGGQEVDKLRGVQLPVWSNAECDESYFQPITEVFLCAGFAQGGKDACQGDSGGPLLLYDEDTQSNVLIGIVSFGNRCAEAGYPGVYTRITHFIDWILTNMN